MATRGPNLFCWSGGKDSAVALHALLQRSDISIPAGSLASPR